MEIKFFDFRTFHNPQAIEVGNITLLVGENSAGKTSFLAGLRYILEFFDSTFKPSFNKEPFFLGSYNEIAHFRGGRFGRAPEFAIEIAHALDRQVLRQGLRRRSQIPPSDEMDQLNNFRVRVSFSNYRTQPRLKSLAFSSGKYSFTFTPSKENALRVRVPSSKRTISHGLPEGMSEDDALMFDGRMVEYVLLDLGYRANTSRKQSNIEPLEPTVTEDLRLLSNLYEVAVSTLRSRVFATAPVRTEPKRVYNPSDPGPGGDGEQTPLLMAQLSAFDPDRWKALKAPLERFGSAAGLFETIDVRHLSRHKSGPFQIFVRVGKSKNSIIDAGYGVSQALPIVFDMLRAERESILLFQQPEVHLHPRAQAELASFVAAQVKSKNLRMVMETHSDYIIDRLRMDARDRVNISSDDLSIVYFKKEELETNLYNLKIDSQGNVIGAPDGYREFFLRETARSMDLS